MVEPFPESSRPANLPESKTRPQKFLSAKSALLGDMIRRKSPSGSVLTTRYGSPGATNPTVIPAIYARPFLRAHAKILRLA